MHARDFIRPWLALLAFALLAAPVSVLPAAASKCIAFTELSPRVRLVSLTPSTLAEDEVRITFVTHSTFRIETPGGVVIATDFAGAAGGSLPTVVTMNHAHETHYTDYPDPGIEHVLRGWSEDPASGPARHELTVGDTFIRNVTTDIRTWSGAREADGNSIFIFEVANLCIGHLGHLHHELGPEHLAQIGQLDIVMVPVDGTYTMAHANMVEVMKLLRARLILPMHVFGRASLASFLARMGEAFDVEMATSTSIVVSQASLPASPKVLSMQRSFTMFE
ncbi:MAG: Zn-dependent hydrolase [Rhizobiales bacterium]|nr:Zn-dependent hydrolase [Hyphomicrobiales bacterium]